MSYDDHRVLIQGWHNKAPSVFATLDLKSKQQGTASASRASTWPSEAEFVGSGFMFQGNGGLILGVPITRMPVYAGTYRGTLICGNCHMLGSWVGSPRRSFEKQAQ